jgi:excisionase family DNA binding protein
LDERQFAILVGLCVAACREALNLSNGGAAPASTLTQVALPASRENPPPGNTIPIPGSTSGRDGSPSASPEHKLLLTVEEAASQLSVGRPKMWQLVMCGEVRSLKIGASRRVPVAALEQYVQRLSAETAHAA